MEPKDYILIKIEGEYAYLREVNEATSDKDVYIALALLPAGVDVGDKLHYEMFAYTVVED